MFFFIIMYICNIFGPPPKKTIDPPLVKSLDRRHSFYPLMELHEEFSLIIVVLCLARPNSRIFRILVGNNCIPACYLYFKWCN